MRDRKRFGDTKPRSDRKLVDTSLMVMWLAIVIGFIAFVFVLAKIVKGLI